jgi:hypothetical protein
MMVVSHGGAVSRCHVWPRVRAGYGRLAKARWGGRLRGDEAVRRPRGRLSRRRGPRTARCPAITRFYRAINALPAALKTLVSGRRDFTIDRRHGKRRSLAAPGPSTIEQRRSFISPNEAPLLVTHSLPLGPSVTYGMRSRSAAEALGQPRKFRSDPAEGLGGSAHPVSSCPPNRGPSAD